MDSTVALPGKGKAIVALAASLGRTIYAMVRNGTHFEDGGAAAYVLASSVTLSVAPKSSEARSKCT